MRLTELLDGITEMPVESGLTVTGLSADSRKVRKGDLFFGLRGEHYDGASFARDAVKQGAVAVISESPVDIVEVPCCQVRDLKKVIARITDRFYRHPSGRLHLTGVTGTNGKTTVSHLIRHLLETAGRPTGIIGTIYYITGETKVRASLTTPDPVRFQGILYEMVVTGLSHAVSEVSSHALALKRVDYTDFRISVFTNLSRDHLDFHGDMENYYLAKERLFTELTREAAVVNVDDPYGERLLRSCRERGLKTLSYGFSPESSVRAAEIIHGRDGLSFLLHLDGETFRLQSPMIGITSLYNILAAVSVAWLLGLGKDTIKNAVSTFRGVEGRMEVVDEGQDFTAVLDYAHTPDALEKVLQSLSGLTPGRLIVVFGCGGNRDRGKRPEMGRVAERCSDIQIVTSDNPRDEPPEEIIRDILKGMKGKSAEVIPDRREAIQRAVEIAGKGDLILLAGKGHEEYQEIRGTRYPFSDREILSTILRERTGAGTAVNGVPGEEGG